MRHDPKLLIFSSCCLKILYAIAKIKICTTSTTRDIFQILAKERIIFLKETVKKMLNQVIIAFSFLDWEDPHS